MRVVRRRCCRAVDDTKLLHHQANYSCQTFGMEKPNKPTLKEWLLKQDRSTLSYYQRQLQDLVNDGKEIHYPKKI